MQRVFSHAKNGFGIAKIWRRTAPVFLATVPLLGGTVPLLVEWVMNKSPYLCT